MKEDFLVTALFQVELESNNDDFAAYQAEYIQVLDRMRGLGYRMLHFHVGRIPCPLAEYQAALNDEKEN